MPNIWIEPESGPLPLLSGPWSLAIGAIHRNDGVRCCMLPSFSNQARENFKKRITPRLAYEFKKLDQNPAGRVGAALPATALLRGAHFDRASKNSLVSIEPKN